jgi:RNA processing factor Prp31
MDKLLINPTSTSPSVLFFLNKGVLSISGKSYLENVVEFYKTIENALDDFIENHSHNSLLITCEFEYMNTSSSKIFLNILKKAVDNVEKVSLVWGHEEDDEDMQELGEIFEEFLDIHVEYRLFSL